MAWLLAMWGCVPPAPVDPAAPIQTPAVPDTDVDDSDSDSDPHTGTPQPLPTADTAAEVIVPTAHTADTAPPASTADTGADTSLVDTSLYDPLCAGEGVGALTIGYGGWYEDFVAVHNGHDLPMTWNPQTKRFGVTIDVRSIGLDTREAVNVVLRIGSIFDDSTWIGQFFLHCPEAGPGWTTVRADFPEKVQADIANGDWDNVWATVSTTVTDASPETVNHLIDVHLRGPIPP